MPRPFIAPMKAVIGSLPTDEGWATELKWDGMRLQVAITDGTLTARSSSGRDVTSHFPELADLPTSIGTDVVLDGELVAFENERPSFARLQHRIHVARPTATLLRSHPVVLIVFDLLELGDNSLLGLPYRDRRRLLVDLVDEGPTWRVPVGSDHGGEALLELATQRDLEGVVAKRLDSPYRPGRRSPDWIKVKVRKRQEFVVGGWLEGSGGLAGSIGSLIVGVYDDGRLLPAGSVGSGLRDEDRDRFAGLFEPAECPFDVPIGGLSGPPHWVLPDHVVEVEYSLWTSGENLWHPVFRGLRIDRDPTDVIRELPPMSRQ
ncbi:MAG: bifunctional non-homologous end joining protein LigD [Acidimicrobiales bacterium]|jgi:bifunctional non-homologous end joining protein LigD